MGKFKFTDGARKEAGFTLVELAVVMIIIGLLIGGVLKGQELIANAQITSTASSIKGIDAATTTFRDTFAAMPGDMLNPATRLPNCTGNCAITGANGDGRVDTGFTGAPGTEGAGFFAQLSAADLISGITNDTTTATQWGSLYPEAPIAGGFHAGYNGGGTIGTNTGARAGHYLALVSTAGSGPNNDTLQPIQAFRIDNKLDDGVANTGGVFANAAGTCVVAATGAYNDANTGSVCDLFIRFQN